MNINETNRFKLLMGYDVKKTLTENLQPILEQPNVWKNFLGVADNALDDIFRKGTLKTTQGTAVKSIDDLRNILKTGSKTALDDASGTLLTNTFLKNPAIRTQDKTNLIKYLTNSDDVITKYRGVPQSDIAKRFKNAGYPDDVADEIAKKIANRPAGSTQGLTSAERAQYQKLSQAEKARLGTKNLGQGTREKLIQKVTSGGKNVSLKGTKTPPVRTKNKEILKQMDDAAKIGFSQKWKWGNWLKWGAGLGLSGLAVWWLIANWNGEEPIVPDDMPITDEGLVDTPRTPTTPRYRNCDNEPKYTKGCKTTPEGDIGQVQSCLGIVQDGKFWNRTQAALEAAGFPNGFTKEDISKICGSQTPQPEIPQPSTEYEFEDIEGEESSSIIDNL